MPKTAKKPIKKTEKSTEAAQVLPPGVLAVIKLTKPIKLGEMMVDHLNVRRKAGIREMAAVQMAYRRQGIALSSLDTLAVVAGTEFLAIATLIDEMCQLPSGTAMSIGDSVEGCTEDFFTASLAIRPFVMMLPE